MYSIAHNDIVSVDRIAHCLTVLHMTVLLNFSVDITRDDSTGSTDSFSSSDWTLDTISLVWFIDSLAYIQVHRT